jgi:hypothetical protein
VAASARAASSHSCAGLESGGIGVVDYPFARRTTGYKEHLFNDGTPASDQADQKEHDCSNEENVNERPDCVHTDQSDQPGAKRMTANVNSIATPLGVLALTVPFSEQIAASRPQRMLPGLYSSVREGRPSFG